MKFLPNPPSVRQARPSHRNPFARQCGGYLRSAGLAAIFAVTLLPLGAAESYEGSLKAGDALLAEKSYDLALTEYEAAGLLAATPTEKGLALAKRGVVFVDQKNYASARQAAEEVLAMTSVRPVARVTALQVLANCEMKEDKDFAAAVGTLEQALELEGVDWAQPTLTVTLGDAYRFSGKFDKALEVYGRVADLPAANEVIKSIAWLNMGLTQQYSLHDGEMAKECYQKAVQLNPGLKDEVAGHLEKIP